MIILKKEQVASIPLGIEAIDILYGNSTSEVNSELLQDHSSHNKSIERLENIIKIFQHEQERFDNDFQCFIERRALIADRGTLMTRLEELFLVSSSKMPRSAR